VRGDSSDALWGYTGNALHWLELNMRRSIGGPHFSADEQEIGLRETAQTLAALHLLAGSLGTWAQWMDDAMLRGSRACG